MSYQKEFKNALHSHPHCILGKRGISDEFINHVTKLLKRYKIIKVKALKSVVTKSNMEELAQKVSNLTNSYLLDIRGKIFVLSLYNIKRFK
ncbi:MAG: YhbY family RNA-binding protein [Promethearchaeota archaeon]